MYEIPRLMYAYNHSYASICKLGEFVKPTYLYNHVLDTLWQGKVFLCKSMVFVMNAITMKCLNHDLNYLDVY